MDKIGNEFTISIAKLMDVVVLKDMLRKEHVQELFRLSGDDSESGLLKCYMNSFEKYTYRINGEIVMMFGVDHSGCIWALGTNTIDFYPLSSFKIAKNMINNLLQVHYHLFNYIDSEYKAGLKFAEKLGGILSYPMVMGERGHLFNRVDFFNRR